MNKKVKNIMIIISIIALILIIYAVKQIAKLNNTENINQIGKKTESKIYNNTEENLEIQEKSDTEYTLYNFGYDGCYYCEIMKPIFEKYKDSYSNVTFIEVNIYKERDLADEYNVLYTPTFVIIDSNKNTIARYEGAMEELDFKEFIESNI